MDLYDNSYSRVITALKIGLPLTAIGILSTLFLLARTLDPEQAIPYADVDVNTLAREQRLSAPSFSTVTRDGTALTLVAETVKPDPVNEGVISAQGIKAKVDMPDGASAALNAPSAVLNDAARQLEFTGGVYLESSLGYRIGAEQLTAALDRTDVWSDTPVQGTAPAGRLDAGGMRLTGTGTDGYVLVFNGGVRLIYEPRSASE